MRSTDPSDSVPHKEHHLKKLRRDLESRGVLYQKGADGQIAVSLAP